MSYSTLIADAVVFDSLNGSTTGTYVGPGATYRSGGPAWAPQLHEFNEVNNEYVEYPDPGITDDCTLACWAIIDADQGVDKAIMALRNSAMARVNNSTDNQFRAEVYNGVGSNLVYGNDEVTDGVLTHICFVVDWTGSAEARLYINGAEVGSRSISAAMGAQGVSGLRIGRAAWKEGFDGAANEFGYWNRALTPTEIATLNSGPPLTPDNNTAPVLTKAGVIPGEWEENGGGTVTLTYTWEENDGGGWSSIAHTGTSFPASPTVGYTYRATERGTNSAGFDAAEDTVSNEYTYPSLTNTLSTPRQIGNLSFSARNQADAYFYTTPGDANLPSGEKDFLMVWRGATRTRIDDSRFSQAAGDWLVGLVNGDTNTDSLRLRQAHDGNVYTFYVRQNSSTVVTLHLPSYTRASFGCHWCAVRRNGNELTIAGLGEDPTNPQGCVLVKASTTLPAGWDFDDINTGGYFALGAMSRATSAQDATLAGFAFTTVKDANDLSDIDAGMGDLSTDEGLLQALLDPHAVLSAGDAADAWEDKFSFDIDDCPTHGDLVVGTNDITCIHSGMTGTYVEDGTEAAFSRGPYADVWDYPGQNANTSGRPTHVQHSGGWIGAENRGVNPNSDLVPGIMRYDTAGEPMAPSIFVPTAFQFSDDAGATFQKHYAPLGIDAESHQSLSLQTLDDRITVVHGYHSEAVSNTPETGDTAEATGSVAWIDDTGIQVEPIGELPKSYMPTVKTGDGVALSAQRNESGPDGLAAIIQVGPGKAVTETLITSAAPVGNVGAGYGLDATQIGTNLYALSWATRLYASGNTHSHWGPFVVIVETDSDGVPVSYYAGRTGADVTSSIGSIGWDDDRFYILEGSPLERLKVDDNTDDNLTEVFVPYQIFRVGSKLGVLANRYPVDGSHPANDTSLLYDQTANVRLQVFNINESGHSLDFAYEHDLSATFQLMAPVTDADTGRLEGENPAPRVLYATADRLLLTCAVDDGVDNSGQAAGLGDTRYGERLAMATMHGWSSASPSYEVGDGLTAASLGYDGICYIRTDADTDLVPINVFPTNDLFYNGTFLNNQFVPADTQLLGASQYLAASLVTDLGDLDLPIHGSIATPLHEDLVASTFWAPLSRSL